MEHRVAYYHHPCDRRFSIDDVRFESTELTSRYRRHDSDQVKAIGYPTGKRTVYCLYTPTGTCGRTVDLDLTEAELTAALDPMNPETERPIALALFEAWNGVREEESKRDGLAIYKPMELENVLVALDQTDWSGPATEVAGRLASNMIIRHILPNANHRCSISMLQFYLDFCTFGSEVEYDNLRLHTDDNEWKAWVDDYIRQSKRILDVRRNNVRFKYLREGGIDYVVRKGEIVTDLRDWDLDMTPNDAKQKYAKKHERLYDRFAEEIAERAGVPDLASRPGLSQREFATMLSG